MRKVFTAQVGANGVLAVPLDSDDANKMVRVTIETMDEASAVPTDRESWLRFIERTAGSITDPTFERHPQRDYEERMNLNPWRMPASLD